MLIRVWFFSLFNNVNKDIKACYDNIITNCDMRQCVKSNDCFCNNIIASVSQSSKVVVLYLCRELTKMVGHLMECLITNVQKQMISNVSSSKWLEQVCPRV